MTTRKRISILGSRGDVTAPTPPGSGGTLEWGPDFGGDGHNIDVQAAFDEVEFVRTQQVIVTPVFDEVELVKTQGVTVSVPTSELEVVKTQGVNITPSGELTVVDYLATKDSWVDDLAVCTGNDNNHDTTDLITEGTAVTKKTPYMGWDLSGLPAGATVLSATVTMRLKATTALTNQTLGLATVADHTWDETTIRCSNNPSTGTASSAADTISFAPADVGSDKTWTLNSGGRSDLEANLGGPWSVAINAGVAVLQWTFESKDEGTNDSLGPRLTLTIALP